jgi:hypothetical protein
MSANELLKAWLPVYHAVDSGEVTLRLARALAASPESSAVWLPTEEVARTPSAGLLKGWSRT